MKYLSWLAAGKNLWYRTLQMLKTQFQKQLFYVLPKSCSKTFCKIHKKTPATGSYFYFVKKVELHCRFFLVGFANILIEAFSQNTEFLQEIASLCLWYSLTSWKHIFKTNLFEKLKTLVSSEQCQRGLTSVGGR